MWSDNVVGLIIPAFLAGLLSFLSPCTLPVLPAYFAWTFGLRANAQEQFPQQQYRVLFSSLAFFAGLATTMVILGMILSSIGQMLSRNLTILTQVGGTVIIGLGILNIFGKGFAGPTIKRRQAATLGSAYLYGLTFALGWTACIGPILGTILTLLVTSGASAIAGAALTFVYVLGLAAPLVIVATFFDRLGQGSRGWVWLRGRAWEINVGSHTILLHSTNVLSGLLLIIVGALLLSGQLSQLNQYGLPGGITEWANEIQTSIRHFFTGQ
jgi:cytochrome c-type biogenesis protein